MRPRGYVAPWWELSADTVRLLLKNGIVYDHSRMDNDFHPFYARVGDYLDEDRLLRKPAETPG